MENSLNKNLEEQEDRNNKSSNDYRRQDISEGNDNFDDNHDNDSNSGDDDGNFNNFFKLILKIKNQTNQLRL